MDLHYSVISGFLGESVDRFKEYQEQRDLAEKFKLASRIEGLDGLELIYPTDFNNLKLLVNLLEEYKLGISAINVNIKSESKWDNGALTAKSSDTREEAISYIRKAMSLAEKLNAPRVTCCPLHDGHDYPFQDHYGKSWNWIIKGFRKAANHNNKIDLCIEYKFNEPMGRQTIGTVGKAMHVAKQTGKDNVGVTVDIGHALLAEENPAESVAILAEEGIPYYIHINDNYRNWDWDMMAGTVNVWDYIETLLYLREYGYEGWVAMDVMPKFLDTVEVFETTIGFMKKFENIVNGIDTSILDKIDRMELPSKFKEIFDQTIAD